MTRRLGACLRQTDTLARLGGDEFVLLLVDLGADDEWRTVMQRVLATVAEPVVDGAQQYRVSCSLGVNWRSTDWIMNASVAAPIGSNKGATNGRNNDNSKKSSPRGWVSLTRLF